MNRILTSMNETVRLLKASHEAIRAVYFALLKEDLPVVLPENPPSKGSWTFRINMVPGWALSIACPYVIGARSNLYAETGLINTATGNLVYPKELGYEDVCTLYSHEELVTEIVRVADMLKKLKY